MVRFSEISEHVTVMHHDFVEGTCSIISGDERSMVVDAGAHPSHAEALESHLRTRGERCDVFGLTHGHGDHVAGAVDLDRPDAVVAHPGALARALAASDRISDWTQRPTAEVARVLSRLLEGARMPDSVDLGGVHVAVLPTPGHTTDSVCFVVDGVLIAGDTVVTSIPPAFRDGHSGSLETTLDRLAARRWNGLVPGHGPVLGDADAVTDWLIDQRDYVGHLRSMTASLIGSSPIESVIDEVASSLRIAGLPDTESVRRRLRANVRALISESLEVAS